MLFDNHLIKFTYDFPRKTLQFKTDLTMKKTHTLFILLIVNIIQIQYEKPKITQVEKNPLSSLTDNHLNILDSMFQHIFSVHIYI